MIGPLLATALASVLGAPVETAAPLRNAGQWAIGTALGLYFTPEVLRTIVTLAPVLLAGIVWALVLGFLFYRLLAAVSSARTPQEHATAFFAAAIGGASEMAVLGEHHGGRIDRIAAAHSLRVLIVVVTIPFGLQIAGLRGIDAAAPGPAQVHLGGLLLLGVLTVFGAFAAARLRMPNAWVLGPLTVAPGVDRQRGGAVGAASSHDQCGAARDRRGAGNTVHAGVRAQCAALAGGGGARVDRDDRGVGVVCGRAGAGGRAALGDGAAGHVARGDRGDVHHGEGDAARRAGGTAFHVTRYVAVLLSTGVVYRRWVAVSSA